jgi:hypothetical protein
MSGKRKSKKKDKRVGGGIPFGEISLSLRSNLDLLFARIENIGAIGTGARRAAGDHLSGHLFETIDRLSVLAVQKKDSVAAQRAAQTLSILVCRCINRLIGIGSAKQDTIGKRCAGESLARVDDAVEKHRKTLSRVNSAYRETKAEIRRLKLRRDIVAAPGPIGQIVQKELAIAEYYRERLLFYRRLLGKNRKSFRTQIVKPKQVEMYYKIPREYRRTLKLPDFTEESEPQWWEFLWPLIKKNNPDLLVELREGKFPTRGIRHRARWSSYRKEFRSHLRTLARLRSGGTLIPEIPPVQ